MWPKAVAGWPLARQVDHGSMPVLSKLLQMDSGVFWTLSVFVDALRHRGCTLVSLGMLGLDGSILVDSCSCSPITLLDDPCSLYSCCTVGWTQSQQPPTPTLPCPLPCPGTSRRRPAVTGCAGFCAARPQTLPAAASQLSPLSPAHPEP